MGNGKLLDCAPAIGTNNFQEIKDALRKTLHTMLDLDFQDGKLDGAINLFLYAKKFQISLTLNLNPNDVILVRNLTKNEITEEVLENIRRIRNSEFEKTPLNQPNKAITKF